MTGLWPLSKAFALVQVWEKAPLQKQSIKVLFYDYLGRAALLYYWEKRPSSLKHIDLNFCRQVAACSVAAVAIVAWGLLGVTYTIYTLFYLIS